MCEFVDNVLTGFLASWSPTTTKRLRDLEVSLFLSFDDILPAPLCRRITFGQFGEWADDGGIALNEPPIVPTKP